MVKLLLLGTQGCHLCDEAKGVLEQCQLRGVNWTDIDIAEQTQWQAKFADCIPVLYCCETGDCLRWPFTPSNIENFIKPSQTHPSLLRGQDVSDRISD